MLFTQRLEHRIPPELNGSDTCKELVGRLYKEHNEVFEETDDEEFGGWLMLRNQLKEQIDLLEEEHKKPRQQSMSARRVYRVPIFFV
jgi:hypothetical protein